LQRCPDQSHRLIDRRETAFQPEQPTQRMTALQQAAMRLEQKQAFNLS
jgi:hypothetical protein